MPIPLANLDDRRWADLAEEGRAQITRYAPGWTDHNLHDPGITLIDLYAWLAESMAYRLNRVSARQKRKFVELLGFPPRGPVPASVFLSFSPPSATPPFTLPAGAEFEGTGAAGEAIPFRTVRDLVVSDSVLSAIQVDDGSGSLTDRTADYAAGSPVRPFGVAPVPGAALHLGFDPLETGVPVSIGIRLTGPGNDETERRRILNEAAAQAAACLPPRTRFRCAPDAPALPPPLPPHHSARLVWEALTGAGWEALACSDDTRSLTLDGFVELALPATIVQSPQGEVAQPLFYVRCRMEDGAYDAVPEIAGIAVNAVEAGQSVPATQTFVIERGVVPSGTTPVLGDATHFTFALNSRGAIAALDFGGTSGPLATAWGYFPPTVSAEGSLVVDLRLAGTGTGMPDQVFELPGAPVAAAEVWTLTGTRWERWIPRADFDPSARTDFDYVLDAATGLLRFGSGERGRVPEAGASILVSCARTAAAAGNLPAGAIGRPRQSPVNDVLLAGVPAAKVVNRRPAAGGSDAEALEHAEGRAVETLHAHERLLELAEASRSETLDQIDGAEVRALTAPRRAVNLIDLERIALSVPGTRVARARAWASLDPGYPCLEAPGVLALIVVPEAPSAHPAPSRGLLDAVWRYVDRRRMLTSVVRVAGPEYVEVSVAASVHLLAGASAAKVSARVLAALNAFLDPLTGGPSGLGWPFGRSVFRTEILQLIDGVPGVDHVVNLSITADSGPSQCGDIALCPMALAAPGQHRIEVL
jgi:hypothetical protein